MVDCFILLNSGDKILLNDGVSALLKNSCEEVVVKGVQLEGTHAVADLRGIGLDKKKDRVLVYTLEAYAQVSKIRTFRGAARILSITESVAKARLYKNREFVSKAQIIRNDSFIAESMIFHRDPKKREFYHRVALARNNMIEQKKYRLRKLFDEYLDVFGE